MVLSGKKKNELGDSQEGSCSNPCTTELLTLTVKKHMFNVLKQTSQAKPAWGECVCANRYYTFCQCQSLFHGDPVLY